MLWAFLSVQVEERCQHCSEQAAGEAVIVSALPTRSLLVAWQQAAPDLRRVAYVYMGEGEGQEV